MKERHNVPDTAEQTITLPAEPASAARAREFVRMLLRGSRHHQLEDAALLCVSELVTNVSVHTRALECVLTIVDRPRELLIEVADRSDGRPVMETTPPSGDHGRGLRIVDALAGDWGVREDAGAGKCVWLLLCDA